MSVSRLNLHQHLTYFMLPKFFFLNYLITLVTRNFFTCVQEGVIVQYFGIRITSALTSRISNNKFDYNTKGKHPRKNGVRSGEATQKVA